LLLEEDEDEEDPIMDCADLKILAKADKYVDFSYKGWLKNQ